MPKKKDTTVEHDNTDRRYFTLMPNSVWKKASDPYELTFWTVVKLVAGEDGDVNLSTEELAALAMMSVGMASRCRSSLIRKGLLDGKIVNEQWRLWIPDLWKRNAEESTTDIATLLDKIAWKRVQAAEAKEKKRLSQSEAIAMPSQSEAMPSPGESKEKTPSQSESNPSPGEGVLDKEPIKSPKTKTRKKNHAAEAAAPTACSIFRTLVNWNPKPAGRDLITRSVETDDRSLAIWIEAVTFAVAHDWNTRVIANVLEVYTQMKTYPGEAREAALAWQVARERDGWGSEYQAPAETHYTPRTELTEEQLTVTHKLEALKSSLSLSVTRATYDKWFLPLREAEYDPDTNILTIYVQNHQAFEWITARLKILVDQHASQADLAAVVFVDDSEEAETVPQQESALVA